MAVKTLKPMSEWELEELRKRHRKFCKRHKISLAICADDYNFNHARISQTILQQHQRMLSRISGIGASIVMPIVAFRDDRGKWHWGYEDTKAR